MKQLIIIITLFFSGAELNAQVIGVPYRKGDKFGISNEAGKILISPQFDIIEPEKNNGNPYFETFIFRDSTLISGLIYNNKIILSNQKYQNYYLYDELFMALEYIPDRKKTFRPGDAVNEKCHVYTIEGKALFKEDFRRASTINNIKTKEKTDEVVLETMDMNNKSSLFVYNKKLKKITQTIVNRTSYLDAIYNYDDYNMDQSLIYVYEEAPGKGRKIKIELRKGRHEITESETADIKRHKQKEREGYGGNDMVISEPPMPAPPAPPNGAEMILDIRKAELKRNYYWIPRSFEEIRIYNIKMNKEERYIVSKDGKKGLFNSYSNKFIIPVEYDEILDAEFTGRNGGHLLRNGNKYGMFIYDYPNNMTITPVYDYIPLLVDLNYFREKSPLIKLYDDKGKLFCYANQFGKLYYSAK